MLTFCKSKAPLNNKRYALNSECRERLSGMTMSCKSKDLLYSSAYWCQANPYLLPAQDVGYKSQKL